MSIGNFKLLKCFIVICSVLSWSDTCLLLAGETRLEVPTPLSEVPGPLFSTERAKIQLMPFQPGLNAGILIPVDADQIYTLHIRWFEGSSSNLRFESPRGRDLVVGSYRLVQNQFLASLKVERQSPQFPGGVIPSGPATLILRITRLNFEHTDYFIIGDVIIDTTSKDPSDAEELVEDDETGVVTGNPPGPVIVNPLQDEPADEVMKIPDLEYDQDDTSDPLIDLQPQIESKNGMAFNGAGSCGSIQGESNTKASIPVLMGFLFTILVLVSRVHLLRTRYQ